MHLLAHEDHELKNWILCVCAIAFLVVNTGCNGSMSTSTPPEVMKSVVKSEFIAYIIRMILGAILTIAGLITSILGISGNTTWFVEGKGFKSKLYNATPGVIAMIVGSLAFLKGTPNIHIGSSRNTIPTSKQKKKP